MNNKLIEDNNNRNFFLIQVSKLGSENILNNLTYKHYDWKSNQRDYDHGRVKMGDYLLVYFAKSAIDFKQQLKKIYRVDFISKDNIQFKLHEIKNLNGITLKQIQEAVDNKILPKTFGNLGLQGFNIIKIEKSDYDSILLLDKNFVNKNELQVFLTGYPQGNLQISKEQDILGWKENPKSLSVGDYVFVYNITSKKIECGFKIKSKSNIQKPIWEDEINSDSSQQKYQFRWDAELICDHLNINLNDISQIEPFKAINNGKKANFGFLVGRNSPNSLRNPVYKPFKDYLISKCGNNQMKNEQVLNWSFDIEEAINEILLPDTESELAIQRETVKRILNHLKSGKHVILVGPPGVGKTDLARRILKIISKKVIGYDSFLESVASDEWSRFEVIGGITLSNKFQEGWVTKAIIDKKWLLIDEFNRANMNKAFGEMFLAIEYYQIQLRPSESEIYNNSVIEIPQSFRMICTMNDFDKNLLLSELSYGLISRFAFVSITPDTKKETEVVKRRVEKFLDGNINYQEYTNPIETYFNFINDVRKQRNIGVRTSIDVIKYLIISTKDNLSHNDDGNNYKWIALNEALCDYVLPQFDRLDGKTIKDVLLYAENHLNNNAFEPFKEELQKDSDRLQKASEWLSDKNGI